MFAHFICFVMVITSYPKNLTSQHLRDLKGPLRYLQIPEVYHPYAWVLYVLGANLLWAKVRPKKKFGQRRAHEKRSNGRLRCEKRSEKRWLWVNTYRYIFSGLFTSINPSYFDVHQGYQGFDPSPDQASDHRHQWLKNMVMILTFLLNNIYIYKLYI